MAKPSSITWRFDMGDGLRAHRIVIEARETKEHRVINRTGTHKAQHIAATNTAEAWIEIPLRAVLEKKPEK